MPEEKLSYTRGVLDKIRASYEKLSREELLDLICYVSKTYIVEQTIPFDVPLPEKEEAPPDEEVIDAPAGASAAAARNAAQSSAQRFATLMEGLKKRTQLPQLEHFTIEDGRAVLVVDNQKITFGDRVTVEFMPTGRRNRPPTAPGPIPAPLAAPAPAPAEAPAPPPPGARKDLPGGDGRIHQGGPRPPFDSAQGERSRTPPARPAPQAPAPKKAEPAKADDLTDVDHIVERFKRLDLD